MNNELTSMTLLPHNDSLPDVGRRLNDQKIPFRMQRVVPTRGSGTYGTQVLSDEIELHHRPQDTQAVREAAGIRVFHN